jgi:hypothetical protein
MRGILMTSEEVRFDGKWWQGLGLKTTQSFTINPILAPQKQQKQPKMGYEYTDSRNFGNKNV